MSAAELPGRLEVTPAFLLMAGVALMLDTEGVLPQTLFAAALHELGHLLALHALGGRLLRLRLSAAGAEIQTDLCRLSHLREFLVYAAGPGASMLLGLFAALCRCYVTAGVSMALGLFNLLPAGALDGGGMLRCLCCLLLKRETGFPRIVSFFTAALIFCAGLYGVFRGGFCLPLVLFAAWMMAGEAG